MPLEDLGLLLDWTEAGSTAKQRAGEDWGKPRVVFLNPNGC